MRMIVSSQCECPFYRYEKGKQLGENTWNPDFEDCTIEHSTGCNGFMTKDCPLKHNDSINIIGVDK